MRILLTCRVGALCKVNEVSESDNASNASTKIVISHDLFAPRRG
jgi:hypothetical protein